MAVIYDQAQAQDLEQAFMKDMELCKEWTVEEYMSRPAWQRLRDSLSRLASPML
jgi:cardiolipin synthase